MTLAAAAKPAVAVIALCLAAGSLAVAAADGPTISLAGDGVLTLVAAESGDVEEKDVEIEAEIAATDDANEANQAIPQLGLSPDVLIDALVPVGAVGPLKQPLKISATTFSLPGPGGFQTSEFQFADSPVRQVASSASPETLRLEAEYWDLKADGLKKKTDALRMKAERARSLQEIGQEVGENYQVLETEAEAELTLAEVKFCQLNAQRVKEALEAVEAGALKSGDTGEAVKQLQQSLNLLKDQLKLSAPLEVDGEFGPLTEQAVIAFQKAHGLKPTGVADGETLQMLARLTAPFGGNLLNLYGGPNATFGAASPYVLPLPAQAPTAPTPPRKEGAPPKIKAAVLSRAKVQSAEEAKAQVNEVEAAARAAAQMAEKANREAARKLAAEMEKLQQQNNALQEQLRQLQNELRREQEEQK